MKTTGCRSMLAVILLFSLHTHAQLATNPSITPAVTGQKTNVQISARSVPQWRVKKQSDHQTEWSTVRYMTNPATGRIRALTNSYVELGTGLNRRDSLGRWQRSSDAFLITTNGAEALLGQHRVRLAGNINTPGAVSIGKGATRMQAHPLCVAYYDPVDGRSELIAEIKDAVGWLVSSNEVVYSNCFDGIQASIRYRNSRSGVEQDLILHEQLPVTPEQLGFSDRTRLEIFTEWVGDTPMPVKESRVIQEEKMAELRQTMIEPDFTDQTLKFGQLRIGAGRAFTEGADTRRTSRSVMETMPVGKRFELINGRKILIEAVPMRNATAVLNRLPPARTHGGVTNAAVLKPGAHNKAGTEIVRSTVATANQLAVPREPVRSLPPERLAQSVASEHFQIQTASVNAGGEPSGGAHSERVQMAFVVDWNLQLDDPIYDFTFHGANTYRCSGTVNLDGTTTFEGGTVIKYDEGSANAILQIFGPVDCKTELYRPAFFTSVYDNTVGESILSGTPGRYFQALAIGSTGQQLKHLRISYAEWGLHSYEINLRHSQITHCEVALATDGGACNIGNVLVQDAFVVFMGYSFNANVAHLTANQCSFLAVPYSGFPAAACSIDVRNSMLVDIAAPGAIGSTKTATVDWPPASGTLPYPFQTVGAGGHYLNHPSYQNVGSPAIDTSLKAELEQMTTVPPQVLIGTATPNLVLAARPILDADNLDLGYHYPVLDYAVGLTVVNTSVLLTNGVGITPINYHGFILQGGQLVSEGLPNRQNRLLPSTMVQEQKSFWNNVSPSSCTSIYPGPTPGSLPNKTALRFTVMDKHQYSGFHSSLSSSGLPSGSSFSVKDSHILGGEFHLWDAGANVKIGVTNTAFSKAWLIFFNAPELSLYNNLFENSSVELWCPIGGIWRFHDNLFASTAVYEASDTPIIRSHNAFHNCQYEDFNTPYSGPSMPGSILLSSLIFDGGPFGSFYLPATAIQLINQGSRTAAAAGLFHYTTSKIANTKEGTEAPPPYQVNIGLHYVGVGADGKPLDSDGEGLADYVEDRNGNSAVDSGETGWQVGATDSDLDGVSDFLETIQGRNPVNPGALADSVGSIVNLKIYTR